MISNHTTQVAKLAKAIYSQELQAELEAAHPDRFLAIEPESGEHFLADSFAGAVAAVRAAHPDRISFVIHIGTLPRFTWEDWRFEQPCEIFASAGRPVVVRSGDRAN